MVREEPPKDPEIESFSDIFDLFVDTKKTCADRKIFSLISNGYTDIAQKLTTLYENDLIDGKEVVFSLYLFFKMYTTVYEDALRIHVEEHKCTKQEEVDYTKQIAERMAHKFIDDSNVHIREKMDMSFEHKFGGKNIGVGILGDPREIGLNPDSGINTEEILTKLPKLIKEGKALIIDPKNEKTAARETVYDLMDKYFGNNPSYKSYKEHRDKFRPIRKNNKDDENNNNEREQNNNGKK